MQLQRTKTGMVIQPSETDADLDLDKIEAFLKEMEESPEGGLVANELRTKHVLPNLNRLVTGFIGQARAVPDKETDTSFWFFQHQATGPVVTVPLISSKSVRHQKMAEIRKQQSDLSEVLYFLIDNVRNGVAVTIQTNEKPLSTQQAAEVLNLSRPTVVKLMDSGEIPFTLAGTHRRANLSDVDAYKERLFQQQEAGLAEMAELAQKYDMGYED
ncbi:MAG: helix-turn-helix domain-containing protein [Motiliproteus sp.]